MMELELRRRIHDALAPATAPALRRFASAIIARNGERMACWGDLADVATDTLARDEDSIDLWRALVAVGDLRPMLIFIDFHRGRPHILEALLADAGALPFLIQCALVSLPEAEPLVPTSPAGLCAAARELAAAPPERRERDRAVYQSHMSALRGQRAARASTDSSDAVNPQPHEVSKARPKEISHE
jgi:hypothetical protein